MARNLTILAFLVLGGIAALWLNFHEPSKDPSLSNDPDIVDAYGGTILLRGGSIDLPPPGQPAAEAPQAADLGKRLRGLDRVAIASEFGAAQRERELGDGLASAWYDRAVAADPDRDQRPIGVHVVVLSDAAGKTREVLAVASGGRIVGRW